jgi:hypothetical protein
MFVFVVAMEYPWCHFTDRFPNKKRFQNPLYGRFRLKTLGLLQREDWDDMVQTIGELAGLEYTAESLDALYYRSSGHPEIARKLCSCLVELRDSGEIGSYIVPEDVQAALGYFLDHPSSHHAYYLKTTFWNNPLSTDLDTEQRLIQELAKEEKVSESTLLSDLLSLYGRFIKLQTGDPASEEGMSREKNRLIDALKRLVDLQIVTHDNQQGTYAVSIPIYRDWIRQEILGIEVEHI